MQVIERDTVRLTVGCMGKGTEEPQATPWSLFIWDLEEGRVSYSGKWFGSSLFWLTD